MSTKNSLISILCEVLNFVTALYLLVGPYKTGMFGFVLWIVFVFALSFITKRLNDLNKLEESLEEYKKHLIYHNKNYQNNIDLKKGLDMLLPVFKSEFERLCIKNNLDTSIDSFGNYLNEYTAKAYDIFYQGKITSLELANETVGDSAELTIRNKMMQKVLDDVSEYIGEKKGKNDK